jgi:hypothetical protein
MERRRPSRCLATTGIPGSPIKLFNKRVKGTVKSWFLAVTEAILGGRAGYLSKDGGGEGSYAQRVRGPSVARNRLGLSV